MEFKMHFNLAVHVTIRCIGSWIAALIAFFRK